MRLFDSSLDQGVFGNPMPSPGCPADFAVNPPSGETEQITSITYDAFGTPSIAASADAEFVGRYTYDEYDYDVDAGFHACSARCYDPTPGRWLSQDPLGFEAGDTNLYRYCVPAQGRLLPEK